MAEAKLLVRESDGKTFAYHPILAKRVDMAPARDREHAREIAGRTGGDDVDHELSDDDDTFRISQATKDQLEAFAKDEFSVDLDKRKKIDELREEVWALVNGD